LIAKKLRAPVDLFGWCFFVLGRVWPIFNCMVGEGRYPYDGAGGGVLEFGYGHFDFLKCAVVEIGTKFF
jgi:hypothetical protein